MRRNESYTVPQDVYDLPEGSSYREEFARLSLIERLLLRLRMIFAHVDMETAVKERKARELLRPLTRGNDPFLGQDGSTLGSGLIDMIQPMQGPLRTAREILTEATGTAAGRFLQEVIEIELPDASRDITNALRVPKALLDAPDVGLVRAKTEVRTQLNQTIEVHEHAIRTVLTAVWTRLAALFGLSRIDLGALLPPDGQPASVPLRGALPQLIALRRALDVCMRYTHPKALSYAAAFAERRLGKKLGSFGALEDYINELSQAPLLDAIRVGLHEPQLELKPMTISADWWAIFERSWIDAIDVGTELINHRGRVTETLLKETFEVPATVPMWVPPHLYQRSVGTVRKLLSSPVYRRTRTLLGTLAHEKDVISRERRKKLTEAHLQLDSAADELVRLVGVGEQRGVIGEELRRIDKATSDATMMRAQMDTVYGRYRPELRTIVTQMTQAFAVIAGIMALEEPRVAGIIASGGLRTAGLLEDSDPLGVLALIASSYGRLADALNALFAIEQEVVARQAKETKLGDE